MKFSKAKIDSLPKLLPLLIMIYTTIMLITIVLVYKVTTLWGITISSGTFLIPVWYALGDVITEVYGYRASRRIVWGSLFCQFIFIFTCYILVHALHSQKNVQLIYLFLFDKLPRVFFASFLATFAGSFINIFSLSKLKILTKGKYFWIRCIGSTSIGELIFTVIGGLVTFLGFMPIKVVLTLILSSYIFKIVIAPITATFASVLAKWLKHKENMNVFDYSIKFIPFSLE